MFASTQYRELRERSVDLLLGRVFAPFEEDDLTVEALFEDQVVVVAAKHSPLARRRRLSLADLQEESWVLHPPDTPAGHLAAELFQTAGLKVPQAPVLTLSIHVGLKLVATGQFIAFLPSSVLRFAGKESALSVLPIKLPVQSRTVGIITLKIGRSIPLRSCLSSMPANWCDQGQQRRRTSADFLSPKGAAERIARRLWVLAV